METDHFLKMLNSASLAPLWFLIKRVHRYIICKNLLWVLRCKVHPLAAGLSGGRTREPILMKFGIQQQIRTTVTVMWSNIKSWRTVVVGKYSKCHNSPANGPTGTQVLVVASHHVPNIGNAITPLTARPCPLLGHPAVHANCECTACSAITFSYCTIALPCRNSYCTARRTVWPAQSDCLQHLKSTRHTKVIHS